MNLSRGNMAAVFDHFILVVINIYILVKISVIWLKTQEIQSIVKRMEIIQEKQMKKSDLRNFLIGVQNNSWKYTSNLYVVLHILLVILITPLYVEGYQKWEFPHG